MYFIAKIPPGSREFEVPAVQKLVHMDMNFSGRVCAHTIIIMPGCALAFNNNNLVKP